MTGVPVSRANKLLGASYELYHHTRANETILRTVSYSLPAVLHAHVKTVAPTTAFTSTRLLQQTPLSHSGREVSPANVTSGEPSDVLSRVEEFVLSPAFLRWLYKMPFDNPASTDGNKLGIAGFINEWPNEGDLRKFLTRFRSDVDPEIASSQIVKVVPVNHGAEHVTPFPRQANIDTQYSVALTFPTPIQYYTIGGTDQVSPEGLEMEGDNTLEWLKYMNNMENVPQTISVPYFIREPDLSEEYARTLCDEFKILGARGVSVLAASGDEGVGCGIGNLNNVPFSVSFPASCTSGVYSLLGGCTHARCRNWVQIAHRTITISQVPM